MVSRLVGIVLLQSLSVTAQACLFISSTPPEGWYQWSARMFGGYVASVARDEAKPVDVITVRVVETFKGADATGGVITARVPTRNWVACKREVPAVGARVLVALNANDEVELVPLTDAYAARFKEIQGQGKN